MDAKQKKTVKEPKVDFFSPKTNHMAEIYQPTGIRFALCGPPAEDGTIAQVHEWVKCRDFMPDAVRAQLTSRVFSIYGFKYDPKTNKPIDVKKTRMLVSKAEVKTEGERKEFEKVIKAALRILNLYERYMGLKTRSKAEYVKGTKSPWVHCWLFTGPKEWIRSPYLLSLYSLCIRLGVKNFKAKDVESLVKEYKKCSKTMGSDRDGAYLKTLWNRIHLVLKERNNLFLPKQTTKFDPIYTKKVSSSFHDRTGILSLCKAQTVDQKLNESMKKLFK